MIHPVIILYEKIIITRNKKLSAVAVVQYGQRSEISDVYHIHIDRSTPKASTQNAYFHKFYSVWA